MWKFFSIIYALIINFSTPSISEKNKFAKTKNFKKTKTSLGFTFVYHSDDLLTNEDVAYRIRVIYIYMMVFFMIVLSGSGGLIMNSSLKETEVGSSKVVTERVILTPLDSSTNQHLTSPQSPIKYPWRFGIYRSFHQHC